MTFTHYAILLIAGHCICDYALQGDFMSKAKNRFAPIPGVPWYQALGAHAAIHAGMVYLITGSALFAWLEFLGHFATDYEKCAGRISYNTDQAIHFGYKLAFAWGAWVWNYHG